MSNLKIAVFPGSFDPITVGHESIVLKALPLFDKIIIVVGENANKKNMFSLEQRVIWLKETFGNYPSIEISTHKGLTVDFCIQKGANYIIRGLRTASDFEFERSIGQMNRALASNVETIFFLTQADHSFISSSIVRDVYLNGGDITPYIPSKINIK